MTVRLGLIGVGAIGQVHLGAARGAGVKIAAVADLNEDQAGRIAKEFDIPRVHFDPQALIDSDEVDAVIVAVPNLHHAPLAIAAMQAGKDVLVEKPMALTVAECDRMLDAARRHDRVLQVGFVERGSAVAETARAFIESERLGRLYHIKANYYRRRGIPGLGGWFTTKAMSGGGPLIDIGVHVIDLVMHLAGFPKVKRVSGQVYANFGPRMKNYVFENMWAGPPRLDGVCDVEDAAHALVRLEGGVTMELNAAWAGNFPAGSVQNLLGLFGDKGGITFQLAGDEVRIATEEQGHNVDLIPALRPAEKFQQQLKRFVHSVKTREKPFATGEEGRAVQSIIEAVYRSSEAGREVEVE